VQETRSQRRSPEGVPVTRHPRPAQPAFARGCVPGTPKAFPVPTDGPSYVAALNAALAQTPPPSRDAPLLARLRPYGIGDYGTDYAFRAQIALGGLGANTPAEAIYPTGLTDGNGVPYSGANRYQLVFAKGQQPPARFFWSVTMYDFSGYLVDNAAHRFSVGPSHPPLVQRKDGSVVIAIQATKPTDATVNWLPAPSGQFRLNLRLSGPSRAAIDGVWRPPGVTNLGPAG
jgi:hypothetical protein